MSKIAFTNMLDAKSNLSRLVQAVESGETPEVVIARNGVPAARLVPVRSHPSGQRIGVARGAFDVPDDIDGSNAHVAELFGVRPQ
jgi:prevent-host-death family protein